MKAIPESGFRNNLLRRLASEDLARLLPHIDHVDLPRQKSLSEPGAVSDFTYFPESGIGSIVVTPSFGQTTEVGLFGREGAAPTTGPSGVLSGPYHVFMQVAGSGHRIANAHLQAAMAESVALRGLLTRYLHCAAVQMAYTAYSNATHQIEARTARWLLMCHDRTDGDEIELTHQFVGVMLAVRRQSVTEALHVLEGNHLISASRGVISIRDRHGLRALAGESYGVPEREYATNIGGYAGKD
jgi:CRP-like cAMP-binding protein